MTTGTKKRQQLADCFKLMAIFFYEPELKMWEQEKILFDFVERINKTAHGAYPAAKRMRESAKTFDEEQMRIDHAALFIGPFGLFAAPYGSVYLEKNKRIMGDSTMAVLNTYLEAGLKVDIQEPPDHIAIELEFMQSLNNLEAEALQDGEHVKAIDMANLRAHFLRTCLAPWVHPFCQNIKNGTNNVFYINLAACLEAFIAEISESESVALQEHNLPLQENADQASV